MYFTCVNGGVASLSSLLHPKQDYWFYWSKEERIRLARPSGHSFFLALDPLGKRDSLSVILPELDRRFGISCSILGGEGAIKYLGWETLIEMGWILLDGVQRGVSCRLRLVFIEYKRDRYMKLRQITMSYLRDISKLITETDTSVVVTLPFFLFFFNFVFLLAMGSISQ